MTKNELQTIAFQLISNAGEAFSYFYDSVEHANVGNFEKAKELIALGDKSLNNAHKAQTDLLVAEANEEAMDFSVVLVHAQDHLMTTIMYERIAKQLISILEGIKNE